VLIGRAYLWGLAANGQAGVENVLEIMRMGMGVASVHDLTPDHLVVPDGFHRVLGATDQASAAVSALAAQS
jgi:L-lactate dehydrogenase (cytochrome)/glycolate oxidase